MKTHAVFLSLAAGLLFCQCAKTPEAPPKADYDQQSIKVMQEVGPLLTGDWKLRRLHVKIQPLNVGQAALGLKRDTIFQDFATMFIQPGAPRRSVPNPQYPDFEGSLRFRSKTYPIHFQLIASPERVVDNKGPQAYFLLRTDFPMGSRPTEPDESFLKSLGFLDENFTLEVRPGQPAMTWRGLNRGIDKIELQKQ